MADARPAADVREVPDAGACANLCAFVDDGGGVDGVGHVRMTGGWIPGQARDDKQGNDMEGYLRRAATKG